MSEQLVIIKTVEDTDGRRCAECGEGAENMPGGLGFFTIDLIPLCEPCAAQIEPRMVGLVGLYHPALEVGHYSPKGKNGRRALKDLAGAAHRLYKSNLYEVPDEREPVREVVH